jgi:hypothetical protein
MVRSVPPSLVGSGQSSFWERYSGRNNIAGYIGRAVSVVTDFGPKPGPNRPHTRGHTTHHRKEQGRRPPTPTKVKPQNERGLSEEAPRSPQPRRGLHDRIGSDPSGARQSIESPTDASVDSLFLCYRDGPSASRGRCSSFVTGRLDSGPLGHSSLWAPDVGARYLTRSTQAVLCRRLRAASIQEICERSLFTLRAFRAARRSEHARSCRPGTTRQVAR